MKIEYGGNVLFSSRPLLGDHQAAGRGQQDDGHQTFFFHAQSGFADGFQMRTGVVHQDQAVGIDVRQKVADFGLAQFGQRVAEKNVNRAGNAGFQTGFAAIVHKFPEAGGVNLLFGFGKDFFIGFTGNDLAGAVLLQAFGHIERAHGEKGPGLNHQVGLDGGHQAFQEVENFHFCGHGVKHPPALRVRAFRRGAVVFRFGFLVAVLDYVVQNFVNGIFAAKAPPDNDQQDHSGSDGEQRGNLGVAHAEKDPGIDANELDEKTLQPEENEELAGNHAGSERMLDGAGAAAPDIEIDQHAGDEFINGRGMDAAIGRPSPLRADVSGLDQAVRKGHAPGDAGGGSVIAVAGDEAADTAYGVTHSCSGAGNIQHGEHVDAITAREKKQCGNAGDEAAKPGKAAAEP